MLLPSRSRSLSTRGLRLAAVACASVSAWGLGLLAPASAWATYSIVAVDRETRQVGGAGTSCVGTFSVRTIYGVAVGKGAVHAQAQVNTAGRDRAVQRLQEGVAPADIIAELASAAFDGNASRRQYGVVDLQGRAAGHTGANNGTYAADRQATSSPFAYSVQGNILTGAAVLDQTETAFRGEGCDLAARLMRALEAGGANGQGDSRCTGSGIPSDSAFIEVEREGEAAGSYLRLEVTGTAPNNPLPLLRARFDEWRASHPCPPPKPVNDGGVADAGSGSSSGGGPHGPGSSPGSTDGGPGPGANAESFAACGVAPGTVGAGSALYGMLVLLCLGAKRRW